MQFSTKSFFMDVLILPVTEKNLHLSMKLIVRVKVVI